MMGSSVNVALCWRTWFSSFRTAACYLIFDVLSYNIPVIHFMYWPLGWSYGIKIIKSVMVQQKLFYSLTISINAQSENNTSLFSFSILIHKNTFASSLSTTNMFLTSSKVHRLHFSPASWSSIISSYTNGTRNWIDLVLFTVCSGLVVKSIFALELQSWINRANVLRHCAYSTCGF